MATTNAFDLTRSYLNRYVPRVYKPKPAKYSRKWKAIHALWSLPDATTKECREQTLTSWVESTVATTVKRSEHLLDLEKKDLFFKEGNFSYAKVAGIKSATVEAYSQPPSHREEIISRETARLASKSLDQEYERQRVAARELCEAIAQRYSSYRKKRAVPQSGTKRIDWARCTYTPGVPRLPNSSGYGKVIPKQSIVGTIHTTPKCIKVRQIRPLDYSNVVARQTTRFVKIPQIPKSVRHCMLLTALLQTTVGTAMVEGLNRIRAMRYAALSMSDIRPQMDTEGVDDGVPPKVDQRGNTVLKEFGNVDRSIGPKSVKGFVSESVPLEKRQTTTERWIPIDTFKWDTNQAFNKIIWKSDQPLDMILKNMDNSAMQHVLTHRYIKTGLKVKFQVNSNKFQVGQLVASWLYVNNDPRGEDSPYRHIGSAIQRNYVRLRAGSSNDGELTIPYHYPHSVMRTNKDDLVMGTLSVQVMNPLTVTDTVSGSCHVTVLACFDGLEYYGSIARSIVVSDVQNGEFHRQNDFVTPEMNTIASLMGAGVKVLNTINADTNRDNPPIPLQPGSLIPQAVPSFCYMTGVGEPVNSLRADPRGQAPHVNITDEMQIDNVSRVWGYLRTVPWKVTDNYDSEIFRTSVNPLQVADNYPTINKGGESLTETQYTPLAVLSSMFGEWRGDIEFKFEIVASSFHTGRLIVGMVPGGKSDDVSIDMLKSSAFEVFDIGSSTELIFNAPWYFWNAWGSTRTISNDYRGNWFSTLFLKVMVPLIAIDSVPPNVAINVYMRAGKNFELAIPRPSTLSVSWGKVYKPPSNEYLTPYNTENKVYSTWERNIDRGDGTYAVTIYVQNVSDGWCGYNGSISDSIYELMGTHSGKKIRIPVMISESQKMYPRFACPDPDLKNSNAQGLIFFKDKDSAMDFVRGVNKGESIKTLRKKWALQWFANGEWSEIAVPNPSNPKEKIWVTAPNDGDYLLWERRIVDNITPQMDIIDIEQPASTTKFGLTTFGESISDLKDLCRRWIPYTSISATTCSAKYPRDCPYTARFGIHPVRQLIDTSSASFDNRAREGIISLIGSGYFLWRGSLRFRFVFSGAPPEGTVLYVQHRFDDDCDYTTCEVQYGQRSRTVEDLLSTSYSTSVQCLDVNPSMTVEIPYYSANEGLLVTPSSNEYNYANGRIYVWVHTPTPMNVDVEVYYSFGDDCRFSVWQGYPGLYTLSEITPEPKPQMNTGFPDGFFDFFKPETFAPVVEAAGKISDVADDAKDIIKKVDTTVDTILKKMQVPPPLFKQKLADGDYSGMMKDLLCNNFHHLYPSLSHLVYACVVPSKLLVGFSLFNFFQSLFGFNIFSLTSITSALSSLWEFCFPSDSTQQPQGPMEADHPSKGLFELIINGFGLLLGAKIALTGWDMNSLLKGLFASSLVFRSQYAVTSFVTDIFTFMSRIFKMMLKKIGYGKVDYSFFTGVGDGRLREWLLQVTVLISPQLRTKCFTNKAYSSRVFLLAIMGRSILLSLSRVDFEVPARFCAELRQKVKEILELERELMDRKCYAPIRYEPYCLYLAGDGGCGKSTAGNLLALEIAKKTNGNFEIYSRTAGNKYFDAYTGQDTILIDDFLTMTPNADPEPYNQFQQMKSCAVFNPPYSNVEDKAKYINFMNLIVTSNFAFFDNIAGIRNPDSFNRRRDTLVYFELANPRSGKKVTDEYTKAELDEFMQSKIYTPSDVFKDIHVKDIPLQIRNKPDGTTMSRSESLIAHVVDDAAKYHTRQTKIYEERVRKYQEACDAKNTGETIDEILKKYIDELRQFMPEKSEWANDSFKDFDDLFSEWFKASGASAGAAPQADFGCRTDAEADEYCKFWKDFCGVDPRSETSWRKTGRDQQALSLFYLAQKLVEAQATPEANKRFDELSSYFGDVNWKYHTDDPQTHKDIGQQSLDVDKDVPHFREIIKRDGSVFPVTISGICLHTKTYDAIAPNGLYYYNDFLPPTTLPQSCPVGRCHKISWVDDKPVLEPIPTCTYEEAAQEFVWRNWSSLRKKLVRDIRSPGGVPQVLKEINPVFYVPITWCICFEERFGAFKNQFSTFAEFGKQKFGQQNEEKSYSFHREKTEPIIDSWLTRFRKKFVSGVKWILGIPVSLYKLCKQSVFFSDWRAMTSEERANMIAPYVLIGAAVIGILSFTNLLSTIKGTIFPNLQPSGDYKDIKKAGSTREKALALLTKGNALSDISVPIETSFDSIKKKIKRNIFFIAGVSSINKKYDVRCIGLSGHKFLVLRHYIEFFKNQGITELTICSADKKLVYECSLQNIEFTWTSEGYGVGEFPRDFPRQFSNIIKYMPSEKFDGMYPRDMQILEVTLTDDRTVMLPADDIDQDIKVFGDNTMSSWTISKGFQYPWAGRGRCGSLLLCPSLANPLVGVHTAGNGTWKGYAEKLLKETFEPIQTTLEYQECINDGEPITILDGSYDIQGKVEPEMRLFMNTETKIVPSAIHGVFPVSSVPAPLSKFDPRIEGNPLLVGVGKRTDKPIPFDQKLVEIVSKDVIDMLIVNNKPLRTPGVLTYKQAIEGGPIEGYRHIEFSTSEGFPWIKMRPPTETGKRWMFDLEENSEGFEVKGIFKDLFNVLEFKHSLRRQGIVPRTFFSAQLKDARIPIVKQNTIGKTRVFEMSPIELTIAQRQYFLDFTAAYSVNRLSCENTLGINPDGPEWTLLANKLIEFSPYILSADFSGFGPRLPIQILHKSLLAMWEWYKEYGATAEDTQVREVLSEEIIQGTHIVDDLYFTPSCGLPSGNAATTPLNSISNSHLIRIIFLILASRFCPLLANMTAFHRYVRIFHNGDDIVIAVKEDIISWFNNLTLIEEFGKYLIKMTDSRKTGEAKPYDFLEDISYLKRGFMKHPYRAGQYLAPLEESSILDTANWCRKSLDLSKESLVNSEMCCRLAYTRGPTFYQQVVTDITLAWKKKNRRFLAPSWIELDAQVWDTYDGATFIY